MGGTRVKVGILGAGALGSALGKDRVVSIRAAIPSEAGGPVDLVIVLCRF
jgi:hypothetical protein